MKKRFPKAAMERSRYRSGWRMAPFKFAYYAKRDGDDDWRFVSFVRDVWSTASGRMRGLRIETEGSGWLSDLRVYRQ